MGVTHAEIRNQPQSWRQTLEYVPQQFGALNDAVQLADLDYAVFMGCGTSLYIAQSAAKSFMDITGIPASAVPASEAFIATRASIPAQGKIAAFVISRSGTTSEALLAAKHLRDTMPHVTTIGVTCNADTELEKRSDACISMPWASEKSVVMTQSYTTMLLALQITAALIAGDSALHDAQTRLPDVLDAAFDEVEAMAKEIGTKTDFDKTIFLGMAQNQGLAEEGTLKLKEMTQSVCEAYNPLEFRHGPISIVTEQTLIVLLEGQREETYLPDLYADLTKYGATIVAVGPFRGEGPQQRVTIGDDVPDLARPVLYLPFMQMLAFYRAEALGLNPDQPRNLNQVVVLNV